MLKALVVRLVAVSTARAWATVAAGLLVGVLAVWFAATHFAMTTDTSALISPKEQWRRNETAVSKAFPQNDDLSVIVVDGRTPELAEDAAARLAERLATDSKHFLGVRRGDGGPFLAREGLLLQPLADVKATTEGLIRAQPFLGPLAADPSLRGVSTAFGALAQGVKAGQASLADVRRPLGALADALDKVNAGQPAFFSWQTLVGNGGWWAERTHAPVRAGAGPARLRRPRARRSGHRCDPRRRARAAPGRRPRPDGARDGLGAPVGRGVRLPGRQLVAGDGADARVGAADAVARRAVGADPDRHPCHHADRLGHSGGRGARGRAPLQLDLGRFHPRCS